MVKYLFFVIFFFLSNNSFCQVDTIIDCGVYKSYFDYETLQPLYVSYKLYKGGGKCSRDKFRFKNDTKIKMADVNDYDKSGYDMGHLANAADFAFDCEKDEKTFRFYNCLPQYPNLNRGIWKKWETKIREESQSDSLLILCGGVFSNKKIKSCSNVGVPDQCWKIVYSLSKSKPIYVLWFENISKATHSELDLNQLLSKLPYPINLPK
jgi:endonuclease G